MGNRAYQVVILSLLATMGVGLWLVWPVSDHWAGSGESYLADPQHSCRPPTPGTGPFAAGAAEVGAQEVGRVPDSGVTAGP